MRVSNINTKSQVLQKKGKKTNLKLGYHNEAAYSQNEALVLHNCCLELDVFFSHELHRDYRSTQLKIVHTI